MLCGLYLFITNTIYKESVLWNAYFWVLDLMLSVRPRTYGPLRWMSATRRRVPTGTRRRSKRPEPLTRANNKQIPPQRHCWELTINGRGGKPIMNCHRKMNNNQVEQVETHVSASSVAMMDTNSIRKIGAGKTMAGRKNVESYKAG